MQTRWMTPQPLERAVPGNADAADATQEAFADAFRNLLDLQKRGI